MNAIIGVDVGKQSQTKILKFTKEDWEKERLQLQDQIRIEDYFKKVIALHHEIDEVVIRLLKPLNHEPDGNTSKNHKPDGNTLGTPTEAWISASFDVEPAEPNQPGYDFFYRSEPGKSRKKVQVKAVGPSTSKINLGANKIKIKGIRKKIVAYDLLIAVQIQEGGEVKVIFNGPRPTTNRSRMVHLLEKDNEDVLEDKRVRKREFHPLIVDGFKVQTVEHLAKKNVLFEFDLPFHENREGN